MKQQRVFSKEGVATMMSKMAALVKESKKGGVPAQIGSALAEQMTDFIGKHAPQNIIDSVSASRTGLDLAGQSELIRRTYKLLNKTAPAAGPARSSGMADKLTKYLPSVDPSAVSEGALGGAAVGGAAGAVLDDGSYDTETPMGTVHHEGGITGRLRGALKGSLGGMALGSIARASDSAKFLAGPGMKEPKLEMMLQEMGKNHAPEALAQAIAKAHGSLDSKLLGQRGFAEAEHAIKKHIQSLELGDKHLDPNFITHGVQGVSGTLNRIKDKLFGLTHLPVPKSQYTKVDDTYGVLSPLLEGSPASRTYASQVNDLIDLAKNPDLRKKITDPGMAESLREAIEKLHMGDELRMADAPFKQYLPAIGGAAGATLPLLLGLPPIAGGLMAGAGGVGGYMGLKNWLRQPGIAEVSAAAKALQEKPWLITPATLDALGSGPIVNAHPDAASFGGDFNTPEFINRLRQLQLI